MTKKELQQELDKLNDKATLYDFLELVIPKLNLMDLELINKNIIQKYLYEFINKEITIKAIYKEQLLQTHMYISGNMYLDEEFAKQMRPKQMENIAKVLNLEE